MNQHKTAAEKYSEAIAALTHRLKTWGVDDPETKARAFMHDLACQGWRGTPVEVTPPPSGRPADPAVRNAALEQARSLLRATTTAAPEPDRPTFAALAAPAAEADAARNHRHPASEESNA